MLSYTHYLRVTTQDGATTRQMKDDGEADMHSLKRIIRDQALYPTREHAAGDEVVLTFEAAHPREDADYFERGTSKIDVLAVWAPKHHRNWVLSGLSLR